MNKHKQRLIIYTETWILITSKRTHVKHENSILNTPWLMILAACVEFCQFDWIPKSIVFSKFDSSSQLSYTRVKTGKSNWLIRSSGQPSLTSIHWSAKLVSTRKSAGDCWWIGLLQIGDYACYTTTQKDPGSIPGRGSSQALPSINVEVVAQWPFVFMIHFLSFTASVFFMTHFHSIFYTLQLWPYSPDHRAILPWPLV